MSDFIAYAIAISLVLSVLHLIFQEIILPSHKLMTKAELLDLKGKAMALWTQDVPPDQQNQIESLENFIDRSIMIIGDLNHMQILSIFRSVFFSAFSKENTKEEKTKLSQTNQLPQSIITDSLNAIQTEVYHRIANHLTLRIMPMAISFLPIVLVAILVTKAKRQSLNINPASIINRSEHQLSKIEQLFSSSENLIKNA